MKITRSYWMGAGLAVLLLAAPAAAQRRPAYTLATAAAPAERLTDGERLAGSLEREGMSSARSTAGNAALIAAGLGTMYLAYSEGEEGGGAFGTYIGVLGAISFWAGIIRQVLY